MRVEKYSEVYSKIVCESDVAQELSEYFTFFVPGYKFMPAYKNRMWDGKIRLFNTATRLLYAGLLKHIELFCKERDYELEISDDYNQTEFSVVEAQQFIASLGMPISPRDYQIDAFVYSVRNNRSLLVSPTASGKSLIIYLLARYYNAKTLIVVPTTTLVHQLASDFESYGYGVGHETGVSKGSKRTGGPSVHKIYSGQSKDTESLITITTWQSIYKQPKAWFKQFGIVVGDEAHLFKAKSLTTIMTKLEETKYRFGFTGTLDGTDTHKLVLEGLFGPVRVVTTTAELIEQKHVSDLKIKAIILKYSDDMRKLCKGLTYQDEMDFIVNNEARNRFIKNLALSLKGNTLLLFQYVDKHGKQLYDSLNTDGRQVFFVHGGVDGEERNSIRGVVENSDGAIIVASYGTFSTGINIQNLHNIVFASPSKSRIRNLQSIGRGLRKSSTKQSATLFDIADDLSWKTHRNHTINHFVERIKIYNEEKFDYKVYPVELK